MARDIVNVEILSELPPYITRVTGEIAFAVASTLRRHCQVDTGFLLSTLGVQFTQYLQESNTLVLFVHAADYAAFVKPKGGGRRGQWITNARRGYQGEGRITILRADNDGVIECHVRVTNELVFGVREPRQYGLFQMVGNVISSRRRRQRRGATT